MFFFMDQDFPDCIQIFGQSGLKLRKKAGFVSGFFTDPDWTFFLVRIHIVQKSRACLENPDPLNNSDQEEQNLYFIFSTLSF